MRARLLVGVPLLLASAGPPCMAQNRTDPDEIVSVPRKYVSAEGLEHKSEPKTWTGIGKEIGDATNAGLAAVVDQAERFGATRVGTFVLVMVAWKVMAGEIIRILLGIPIGIAGVFLWIWAMQRCFLGYRVLVKREGKIKTYEHHEPLEFRGDGRIVVGIVLGGSILVWLIIILTVIF